MQQLPSEVDAALRRHADEVERLVRALSEAGDGHAALHEEAEAAFERASLALAKAALPSLDDEERLAAAAKLLHVAHFEPAAVRAAVKEQEAALRARVDAAAEDPRFPTAKARLGELELRLRELAEPMAHLRESVRRLEQDQDFQQYLEGGPQERWWTFSYYRTRAAGLRALERHGARRRVQTPQELVKRHREEKAALATLEQEASALTQEQQALRALVDEHARASAALETVERDLLAELRATYRAGQQYLADEVLLARFREPPLRALARKMSGCRARMRYLEALFLHHIERTRGALVNHLEDVSLALRDPHAPRRGVGANVTAIEAATRERRRQVEEQLHRYRATVDRLLAFTRWDACDPLAGQLWWDAFTDGAIDGSFIDEVAWHRTMGRPRETTPHARVDARDTWARNALSAMDALAEAHAEVMAAKDTAPAPVELSEDDGDG